MNNPELVNEQQEPEIISSRALMGLIGLLAFLLPILLFFSSIIVDDCNAIQSSISAYYHTGVGDGLVGMICALSFAFFSYKGYVHDQNILNDSLFGVLASVFALGVAFFPTSIGIGESSNCTVIFDNGIYGKIHYVSAVLLFLTLALFCMLQFTKTGPNSYIFSAGIWSSLTTKKKSEIKFYIYCGFLIIICMILAAIYFSLGDDNEFKKKLLYYKPIFWLETLMLWAFSAAWLRKSKFFGVYHTVL